MPAERFLGCVPEKIPIVYPQSSIGKLDACFLLSGNPFGKPPLEAPAGIKVPKGIKLVSAGEETSAGKLA